MEIKGKVFQVLEVSSYVAQVILKKRVHGKTQPIAFVALGHWRDVVVRDLKLKKDDYILANFYLKSRLYNGKWYTEAEIRNIQRVEKPQKKDTETPGQISLIPNSEIRDDKGNVML